MPTVQNIDTSHRSLNVILVPSGRASGLPKDKLVTGINRSMVPEPILGTGPADDGGGRGRVSVLD